jgi:formylglycine-generating enzyme required for sulfatase activity
MAPQSAQAGHVFICYAREDQDFVLKLAGDLKGRGVPVWLDQWDIPRGRNWDLSIMRAIKNCATLLIVLSSASVENDNVLNELAVALDYSKTVIPAMVEPCELPLRIRRRHYVDFHNHDYDQALAELFSELKMLTAQEAEEARPVKTPASQPKPVTEPGLWGPTVAERRQPFEPELILIPAGEFLMGSDPEKDKGVDTGEQPQHTLYLPNYHIAKTPVTNAQYLAFVEAAGHSKPKHWEDGELPEGKEDHPVVRVTWHDAMAYCQWLAEATRKAYRLPSEAEWEKAARGTDGRIWPWGSKWDETCCNSSEGGPGDTTPAGQYSPGGDSPYGCVDMAGNVWEWTWSLRRDYPYDAEDGREDPTAGGSRVLRGGAFLDNLWYARCAARGRRNPHSRYRNFGFRVVVAPGL